MEESWYEAEEFIFWYSSQLTSKIERNNYCFIAKWLKKVADLNLDGWEKITLKTVSFDELLEMWNDNSFSDRDIVIKLLEAKSDVKKEKELRKLFKIN